NVRFQFTNIIGQSLVNLEAHLVRDEGVAGSNPTSIPTVSPTDSRPCAFYRRRQLLANAAIAASSARSRAPRALSLYCGRSPTSTVASVARSASGKCGRPQRRPQARRFLVPSDRHGFEDQTGPSLEGQCFWVAPRTAVTLSAKRLYRKDRDLSQGKVCNPRGEENIL